jgi:hypothetical protein
MPATTKSKPAAMDSCRRRQESIAALPPAPTTKSTKQSAHPPAAVARPGRVTRSQIGPAPDIKRGTGYHIRVAVIAAYPHDVTVDEIDKQLSAAGFPNTKRSTITTCKQDCVNTLNVAAELGKLKLSNGVAENRIAGNTVTVDAPASETPAERSAVQ